MTALAEVGVVIVTYNSALEIGECLDAAVGRGADVLVVDNASQDGTVDEVRRRGVRLIANAENMGFAAAVNQGVRALNTDFVVLLNPDAVLQTGFEPLTEQCRKALTAGAGGQLLDSEGRPQTGFMARRLPTCAALCLEALGVNKIWPGNPVNWKYRYGDLDATRLQEVEQPAGAFLMFRRDVWDRLDGFDVRYHPLWFEDVDFCRRALDLGYRLYYVPDAVAKHTGGHSLRNIAVVERRLYWYRSFLRYSGKFLGLWPVRLICLSVAAGSVARMIFESVRHLSLKPVFVYSGIVRLAGRQFFSAGEKR